MSSEEKCCLSKHHAIINNHVICLQVLCKISPNGYAYLTENTTRLGYLDCLKCLVENKMPKGELTTLRAVENGHVECLKYACEHGFYIHTDTTFDAAKNGHLNCIEYIYEHLGDEIT